GSSTTRPSPAFSGPRACTPASMDWAIARRSSPMCPAKCSPSPPCWPRAGCATWRAASIRSGRRRCSLRPPPRAPSAAGGAGPDGSRVLHWRSDQYADGSRFGFDVDAAEMGRRLSDWLLTHPVFLSPGYPYDIALLSGATGDNGLLDERVVANVEEFARRFAYPRLVAARPEDFFREVERRWGTKLPVRRGDTGCYREDGAASTAAELGRYRAAQLVARAAELLALWDEQTEPPGAGSPDRIEQRARARRG